MQYTATGTVLAIKEGEHMSEGNLLKILKESRYTTVLSGFGMLLESGYPSIRDGDVSYDIEQKYGYSMEEMIKEFNSNYKA